MVIILKTIKDMVWFSVIPKNLPIKFGMEISIPVTINKLINTKKLPLVFSHPKRTASFIEKFFVSDYEILGSRP